MLPFGETVTLYHKSGSAWRIIVLTGCSWVASSRSLTLSGNDALNTVPTTCRIPHGQTKPTVGDALFLGNVSGKIADKIALDRLLETKRSAGIACFIVRQVRDNARAGMPMRHYAAIGE